MKPVALASLLIFCVVVLAGCGQKGPLYLPGHNPNPPQPMMSPTSQPQSTDQNRDRQSPDEPVPNAQSGS